MTFQEGGSFEGGRVRTRSRGRTAAVGGGAAGGLGIVVALVVVLLNASGHGDVAGLLDQAVQGGQGQVEGTIGDCSAEQADSQRDCRLSATVQALDAYWQQAVPEQFAQPQVVAFEQATSTGCGDATAATGPFYCPPDATIYLDLSFFDDLSSQYGAQDGPLAEEYVVAHEYGHHIQQLTGVMDKAERGGTGAESDSVRVELQADCYAGIWVGHAASTKDPDTGVTFLEPVTKEQLQQALSAAQAVGDDHLQQAAGGTVDPDSFTHGTSEQRERWFTTGYEKGTLQACDTFAADEL